MLGQRVDGARVALQEGEHLGPAPREQAHDHARKVPRARAVQRARPVQEPVHLRSFIKLFFLGFVEGYFVRELGFLPRVVSFT